MGRIKNTEQVYRYFTPGMSVWGRRTLSNEIRSSKPRAGLKRRYGNDHAGNQLCILEQGCKLTIKRTLFLFLVFMTPVGIFNRNHLNMACCMIICSLCAWNQTFCCAARLSPSPRDFYLLLCHSSTDRISCIQDINTMTLCICASEQILSHRGMSILESGEQQRFKLGMKERWRAARP